MFILRGSRWGIITPFHRWGTGPDREATWPRPQRKEVAELGREARSADPQPQSQWPQAELGF